MPPTHIFSIGQQNHNTKLVEVIHFLLACNENSASKTCKQLGCPKLGVAGFTPEALLFPKTIFSKKTPTSHQKNSHFLGILQLFFQIFSAAHHKTTEFFL